jgi:hypothetical protein
MNQKDLLEKYKEENHILENRLRIALTKIKKMEDTRKENTGKDWYLEYLIKSNLDLERQYADLSEIIEKYQKHYQTYSHFYAEFEKRMI